MIDKIKLSLRISHDKLDTDIQDAIYAAQSEMERLGIDHRKKVIIDSIEVEDPLILQAVKTYCRFEFASEPNKRDGYMASWQYQLDCLRKSEAYKVVTVDV